MATVSKDQDARAQRLSIGAGALILGALLPALLLVQLRKPVNPDLFWQILEGRRILGGTLPTSVAYAIHPSPWIDHEWLFEAFSALATDSGHYGAFKVICVAAFVLAPAFLYVTLRVCGFSDIASAAACAVFAIAETIGQPVRAQTLAYYPFLAELFLLRRYPLKPWLLLPIDAVWANIHASCVLAVAAPLLIAAGYGRMRKWQMCTPLLWASAAAFMGSLVSPLGWHLWQYVL